MHFNGLGGDQVELRLNLNVDNYQMDYKDLAQRYEKLKSCYINLLQGFQKFVYAKTDKNLK